MDQSSSRLALRDRLLRELVEPSSAGAPDASLLAASDDDAQLILPGGDLCWIFSPTEPVALREHASAVLRARRGNSVMLVAVGGGREAAAALRAAVPFFQLRGKIGAYQLDDDGRLRRVTGAKSPALTATAVALRDRLASLAGERLLTRDELEGWIQAARATVEVEGRFTTSLRKRFPIVTASIATICVALFGLTLLWGQGHEDAALWHLGAGDHERILHGEWWRLLSAAFLHLGAFHLVVNMIALASFGVFLERLLGPHRFLVLYTLSGLVGSLASELVPRQGIAVGASGAIWGLMAAGAALAWKPRGLLPPLTLAAFKRQAVAPVVINVFYSFSPGIDYMAHFGGGAAGFALMLSGVMTRGLVPPFADDPEPREIAPAPVAGWRAAAVACGLACLVSIGTSMAMHRPWELDHPVATSRRLGDTGLTIDVPSYMAANEVERSAPPDPWLHYSYGALPRDPYEVEIVLNEAPDVASPAKVPAYITELQRLMTTPIAGTKLVGASRVEKIGGRNFVVADYRYQNDVVIRAFGTVIDRNVVILRVYAFEGGDRWDGATHGLAASLRGGS